MKLHKIIQTFDETCISNIKLTVQQEMLNTKIQFPKGARIAVTVGSRGISNIAEIIKAVCSTVKEMDGNPFIVPAMGSHGGATAEGQQEIVESYGITEDYVGAPILSSMEVVELESEGLCHKLYMDKYAHNAHGVIAINRVKVHTDFHGEIESGVMKMCVIGLGKHAQALEIHNYGANGLRDLTPPAARKIIESGKILMGIGILENAHDKVVEIKAVQPNEIELMERNMLDKCRKLMPSLPSENIDVLIVDRIGKNISGVGMDTNIIGRMRIVGEPEPKTPSIKIIIANDLTEESHGNALGMGLSDIITEKLRNKIDFNATYENVLTSTFIQRGFMPIVVKNIAEGLKHGLRCSGCNVTNSKPRVMRIRDTLHMGEIYVSKAILEEISKQPNIKITNETIDVYDGNGDLLPWK